MRITSIGIDWPWWNFALGYHVFHGTTEGIVLYLGPLIIALNMKHGRSPD